MSHTVIRSSHTTTSAVMSSATSNHLTPSSTTPWDFPSHLRTLFPSRPPLSSHFLPTLTTSSIPSLDGLRAVLCLAMITYHTQAFLSPHVVAADGQALFNHPLAWLVGIGPVIVDWFFVLTGFLTALPLFQQEKKALQQAKEDGASSSPPPPFSLSSFYFRRFSRLLPCWLLVYSIHHFIIFPTVSMTYTCIRNTFFKALFSTLPPSTLLPHHIPSNCAQPAFLPLQLTFLMHLLPFGGCQGATWSLGVQAQFWLWFPLLWAWMRKRGGRASEGVVRWMWGVVVVWVVMRVLAFFHACQVPLWHFEGSMIYFFWYSNTFTRMGTIASGVLLAYYSTFSTLPSYLRSHPTLRYLLYTSHVLLLIFLRYTMKLHMEGPALSLIADAQSHIPMLTRPHQTFPPSLTQLTNLPHYLYHLVFQTLFHVGSPAMAALVCLTLMCVVHRVDEVGRVVSRVLEWRGWQPVAVLSWGMYLVHPSLQTVWFQWYTDHVNSDWVPTVGVYWLTVVGMVAVSAGLALVMHVAWDGPMQAMMAGWKAGEKWIWRYVMLCMGMSVVCHAVFVPVLLLAYKPTEDALWVKTKTPLAW